jgi:hypothetical protein
MADNIDKDFGGFTSKMYKLPIMVFIVTFCFYIMTSRLSVKQLTGKTLGRGVPSGYLNTWDGSK